MPDDILLESSLDFIQFKNPWQALDARHLRTEGALS
jgi:hypothetical protein